MAVRKNLSTLVCVGFSLIALYLFYENRFRDKLLKNIFQKMEKLDKLLSENNTIDKKLRKTENMNLQTKLTQLMDKLREEMLDTFNTGKHKGLPATTQHNNNFSTGKPLNELGVLYKNYESFYVENIHNGVPESILKEIVQANLTLAQIKTHFHKHWFSAPSTLPYNMQGKPKERIYFSQDSQDKLVDDYFKQKTNGIFLEVGAGDGIVFSNTLFFERERNWTGLLIEPTRYLFETILKVHRKAYAVNVCLSVDQKISIVRFFGADLLGGIEKVMRGPMLDRAKGESPNINATDALCIPVYSLLRAVNMHHINFFSLDVEGAELKILETIPFDKIEIDLFSIEYAVPGGGTTEKLNAINKFFEGLGKYKQIHRTSQDVLFALK